MRPRWTPVAAALVLGVPAAFAAAPVVDQPAAPTILEVSHAVDVGLADGVALYTVTRVFLNETPGVGEGRFLLNLPSGGAITAVRLFADDTWYAGQLLEAEAAQDQYLALRAPGAARPHKVAHVSWDSQGAAMLELFPMLPRQLTTIEYTITAPVGYERGQLVVRYPEPVENEAPPSLRVTGAAGAVAVVHLPEDDELADAQIHVRIDHAPATAAVLDARYGLAAIAGSTAAVWRLELDAARELGRVPVNARVVFVIDGSWSEGEAGIAAQLQVVRGYLANVPDAEFEIIVYRRTADRLVGGFAPAGTLDDVLAAVGRPRLSPGNGSDLPAGLRAAADVLRGTKGPTRIVFATDGALPEAYTVDVARAALARAPAGTIAHAVLRDGDLDSELFEERVNDDRLTPVAEGTGGMALSLGGGSEDVAQLAAITRGLVRPIRIDDFVVDAPGTDPDTLALDGPFEEATGYRRMLVVGGPPAYVTLSGKIWGRPFSRKLAVDPAFTAHVPALAVGDEDVWSGLSPLEQRTVATAAGAVSPVTSYLAVETGAAPSVVGLEQLLGSSSSCSSHCGGRGCRGVLGTVGYATGRSDELLERLLTAWAQPGVAACARRHAKDGVTPTVDATVDVEATGDEIVGVTIAGVSDDGLRGCLEEAVWALRLSADFRGHRHWLTGLTDLASEPDAAATLAMAR